MLTATYRKMERMSNTWGGGMHSEGPGSYWPYIGADRAVGHILRGEPDRALDYFCAFTDTAGGTFSWGEGYNNVIACGDQPHFWADAQWINLFRHLFVMEDGDTLMINPAGFRRWTRPGPFVSIDGFATHFGNLKFQYINHGPLRPFTYRITITTNGDQEQRALNKLLFYPRLFDGRAIRSVTLNGTPVQSFTNDVVIIDHPDRNQTLAIEVHY